MTDETYARGWQQLLQITGEQGDARIAQLRSFAPELCDYIIRFAYGEIYSRTGLSTKEQMMVTITSLLTQGDTHQLRVHIQSALRVGLTEQQVMDTMIHCIPYIGFPRVMDGMTLLQQVLESEHGRP